LLNRRGLDKEYEILYKSCIRYNFNLAVAIIDIDNFKSYNDKYGHVKGDEVLKNVALALKNSLKRPGDVIGRYGGEEFLAIVPNIDENEIKVVMERMRQAIFDLQIDHELNQDFKYVTVSIGATILHSHDKISMKELVKIADLNLYRAKSEGRNRCIYPLINT
jgi:diguanylate cyclase (GGDEF)-like protein